MADKQNTKQLTDKLLDLLDFNDFATLLKDAPDSVRLDIYLQLAKLVVARRGTAGATDSKSEINKMIDKMFETDK